MTGDGVNDAPALARADAGVAMAALLVLLLARLGGLPLPSGADPVDQRRHRRHGDGEPGDGAAGRRREMRHRPVPSGDRLLNRPLFERVALMTPLIAAGSFGWFVWRLLAGAPADLARTALFHTILLPVDSLLPLLALASLVLWAEEAPKPVVRTLRRARR